MFVAVQHAIADAAEFESRGQRMMQNVPAGMRPHFFLRADSGSSAVCLWEGRSEAEVRAFIDGRLGASSRNDYFTVDPGRSIGLPEPKASVPPAAG